MILANIITRSPTSRRPYHQVCPLAARAGQPNDLGVWCGGTGYVGLGFSAGVGVGERGEGGGFAAGAIAEGGGGDMDVSVTPQRQVPAVLLL